MEHILIYTAGSTKAAACAARILSTAGAELVDHPTPEVTHLLLDVPSFSADGLLRGGGCPEAVLERLPQEITVVGGNLEHPALRGYRVLDLLKDETFLAKNAAITADCALQTAAPRLKTAIFDTPTLVIGWGRIGKCLGQLLRALNCPVTVAARKDTDRAMLSALGYSCTDMAGISGILPQLKLIFNTAPGPVLEESELALCRDCVKIDLASKPGLSAPDVLWARGLPGILAPESTGSLIADTILRHLKEGTS